jgi:FKBP-type peptidyl-prolyl cis-trans isomerase FklB
MKKIFLLLGLASLVCTSYAASSTQLKTQTDKFSYVVGLNLGANFKSQGIQVNPNEVIKGLQDGMSGAKPLLTKAEQQQIMTQYQKMVMAKIQAKNKQEAGTNLAAGQKFLAANAKKSGVKTTKTGLQYKILKRGSGAKPSATDSVTVNYEGKLINGTVFDSSYKRGKPTTFNVNQVIPGWTQALQMMRPGATWMLYIPANLAYGANAMGSTIPANSALIFKVQLISVNKAK